MKKILLTALSSLLFAGLQAQTVSNRKLIAHYELNGNATDISTNALNGIGTDLSSAPDRFNNPTGATLFNGVTSHIVVQDDARLKVTDSLTITAWVYQMAKPNTGWNPVISKRYAFVDDPYASYELNNHPDINHKWIFNISSGQPGSLLTPTSKTSSSFDSWKFIASVFDGNTVKLYINGVLDTTVTKTTPIGYSNLDLMIGYNGTGANEYFKGRLDDIRIYGRALSSTEVNTLYTATPVGLNAVDKNASLFSLFPNPAENTLYFSESISAIQIFAANGKLVYELNDINNSSIDISQLPQGIYFTHILVNNKSHMGKFIKN